METEPQKIPFKRFWPGITWFFVVALLTLMPGKDVPKISWLEKSNIDKLAHAGLFGGLTLLFCLPYFKANLSFKHKINLYIKIALASVIWGITIELIQKYFVPGRDFDLLDWAADTFGVIIALWFCIKVQKSISGRTAPKQ